MFDPNTFDARWTLLVGVPVIAALSLRAVRQSQAVARRIREVREDLARSPQSPYQALAEILAERDQKPPKSKSRRTPWRKG